MTTKLNQKFMLFKEVYSKDKYAIISVIIAILFYVLNASISVWTRINYAGDIFDIIKLYTLGFYQSIGIYAFYSSIILCILTGILLSLLLYRADITLIGTKKDLVLMDYISIFFGIIVPGCPACGLGLIAILGLGASVAALPFHGAELSTLAIIIIIYAIYRISDRILSCEFIGPKTNVKIKNKST